MAWAGLPRRRLDQKRAPASAATAPGSSSIIRARYVIIFGANGGVFVYNGTPGQGNPPIAWMTSGIVDPFGNAIPGGTIGVSGAGSFFAANATASVTILPGTFEFGYAGETFGGFLVEGAVGTSVLGSGRQNSGDVGAVLRLLSVAATGQGTPLILSQYAFGVGGTSGAGAGTVTYPPSGDTTGAKDATAINALFAAHGTSCVKLTAGSYYINAPILPGNFATLEGSGVGVTTVNIVAAFAGSVGTYAAGGSISAAIGTIATGVTVRDFTLQAPAGTTLTNPAMNGIEFMSRRCVAVNIEFLNINGWAVEYLNQNPAGTAFQANTHHFWMNLQGGSNAGGIHINGYQNNPVLGSPTGDFNGYIMNCGIGAGLATGPNANLDCFRVEDCNDVWTWGLGGYGSGVTAGTGSIINLIGAGAVHWYGMCDVVGVVQPGAAVIVDQPGANGNGISNVHFSYYNIASGSQLNAVQVAGSAHDVYFEHCTFGAQSHAVVVSSSGSNINFEECVFGKSGQAAAGTYYDLDWVGTGTGKVRDCLFTSPIVAFGTAGVQFSVNLGAAGQDVKFEDNQFTGTGSTTANQFTNGARWTRTPVATGTATLVGGTVTVATALAVAGVRIALRYATPGGAPGAVYVSAVVAGTSFTITSTNAGDTSTIGWELLTT